MFTQNPANDPADRDDDARLRLLEGMLAGEERAVKPADIQLLDEAEICASSERTATTRAEYRRLQEHFVAFMETHGADLATAKKKHVEFFVAHLGPASPIRDRLARDCATCQAHGTRRHGYSATYVKRHLAAIRALYDYLVEEDVADYDPTARVARPRVQVTRQYTPTLDEVRALMAYSGTPLSRLAVRWAYYEPARRSEVVSPLWSDIDEYGRWHLTAKGGKDHSFKLHPEVLRALRAFREHQQRLARRHPAMARALADPESAYIFLTRRGKPVTGGQFVRILKRHAVRAGVAVVPATSNSWDAVDGMTSRLSPHALRRAWATHSLNDPDNPVPLDVVQMVLGHADISTTRKFYAHTDDGRGDDALCRRRL